MNPHAKSPVSPWSLIGGLWGYRALTWQMAQREVVGRYKGSVLGLAWSLFNPILMLAVYTFVFSMVFKARWTGPSGEAIAGRTTFAALLFVGMVVHALFAEVLNRAPTLILNNQNYVKRVVFPLEILPVVAICAALFHAMVSLSVLLCMFALFNGYLNWTAVFLPLIFLPLIFVTLGLAWMLASLGVFLRDVGQIVGVFTSVLMFLAPVFYPISAVPPAYQGWLMANPLTFIIEQSRDVLVWGKMPDWSGLATYTGVAIVVAWLGYAWFQKTRKGFADVL